MSTTTYTSGEMLLWLKGKFPNAELGPGLHRDKDYALPTASWVAGYAVPSFREHLIHEDLLGEWETKFDCDDYAIEYRQFVQKCFRRTRLATDADGFATFWFFYKSEKLGGGHAINMHRCEDDKIVFVEPQGPRIVELTDGEVDSIWHIY